MKKLLIISSTILTITSGASYALTRPTELGADEKPPIVLQVENHEERIGDLEEKTDKTQTQVNQNTQDIGALQNETGTEPTEPVPEVNTPVDRPDIPEYTEPEPEPEPVNPYKVIKHEKIYHEDGVYPMLKCLYYTHNGELWWIATRSPSMSDRPCQYRNAEVLTELMRRNLTNRPVDVF